MGHRGADCCCEKCNTTCENCAGDEDAASACMTVFLDGIAEGTCGSCDWANRAYYLTQVDETCVWRCEFVPGECGFGLIELEIYKDGADWKMKVTVGDDTGADFHVWEKNFGQTEPNCCTLRDESLPNISSNGNCDSSGATAEVTTGGLGNDGADCPCGGECDEEFAECLATVSNASCWEVRFDGIDVDDACRCPGGDKGTFHACEYLNFDDNFQGALGAMFLRLPKDPLDPCRFYCWLGGRAWPCDADDIELEFVNEDGLHIVRVTMGNHIWEKEFGLGRPVAEAHVLANVASGNDCDTTASTATITPRCAEIDCPPKCDRAYCQNCDDDFDLPAEVKVTFNATALRWVGFPFDPGDCPTEADCEVINDQVYFLAKTPHRTAGAQCNWSNCDWVETDCGPDNRAGLHLNLGATFAQVSYGGSVLKYGWRSDDPVTCDDILGPGASTVFDDLHHNNIPIPPADCGDADFAKCCFGAGSQVTVEPVA